MSRLWRPSGGKRGHWSSAHAGRPPKSPYTCSKIRGLGTHGLAFVSSPFPGTRRAKPFVGPGIECVQIPRMRFFSGKGDSQLLKNTPSGEVNMEAIQTRKERICGLEVVLNRDATSGGGAPNREVQLALPPIERSGFPGIPSLVCHSDIPGECGVLVLGEDVWERGLKVTSLIIDHNLLAGQRHLLLFEMASARYVAELLNE